MFGPWLSSCLWQSFVESSAPCVAQVAHPSHSHVTGDQTPSLQLRMLSVMFPFIQRLELREGLRPQSGHSDGLPRATQIKLPGDKH
ncbi:hypothetical protein RRG08_047145 [Elysia crispata]|uniref:Uncharacterized protein n=1 Tax=Elysia crispata TaxID=231223 RepID=A0AAE1E275_9GAST|nr:hypothetical protein RRG08_047145 [Elysia crispata]